MEKEHWKDEIMRSLDGARRAEPGPELYNRIRAQLTTGSLQVVRRPYAALAAACLALLISANVYALVRRSAHATSPATSVYQLDQANFDLYNLNGS